MAYQFTDKETGHAKVGGTPSKTERHHGASKDNRDLGEECDFEDLYNHG
ncbi:hypothetical protein ACFQGT_09740 [Natrialbaceae archaeon GCM10025810]